MNDGSIKFLLTAGLDRSVEASFGTVEKMAERCGRNVNKAMGSGAGASNSGPAQLGRGFRQAATEADKASRQIEADFAKQIKAAEKASAQEIKAFDRANKERIKFISQVEREQDKALRAETRAVERETAKQEKISERAARKAEAEHARFASRASGRAVKFLFPNPIGAFGMASRIGHDILSGAGVDFSVAGSVSRAVDVQSLSQQISNQGYRAGEKGPAGTRVEGATLEAEARKVGKDLALDPHQLLEAQIKFLDVTGDLDASRKNMKGLAEIAAATNTDFTAMSEAAGNISRHLEEGPDKAEKLLGIMRVMAGQGKVGSIEIKDFATQMAKIAALAPKFAGDVSENITKLTTIAQLSRAEGGSASAAQAATATARFTDVFKSGARMKQFTALGINPYTDAKHTQLQDPFEIIRQSLVKTKGDALKMANLFKSVMAQRGIDALTNAYNKAGGGKAGIDAVNGQFAIFGKESAITKDEVSEDNAKRMATDKAQAQAFQNALDGVISETQKGLTPALIKLKEPILGLVKQFGELVTWTANNPMTAVVAAIGLAITRAGIEQVFRSGVENLFRDLRGGSGGGSLEAVVGGKGGFRSAAGLLGDFSNGLAIATIALAAYAAGAAAISEYFDRKAKEQNAEATATGNDGAALANAKNAIRDTGHLTADQRAALEKTLGHETGQLSAELENRNALQYRLDQGDANVSDKDLDASNSRVEELKNELQQIKQLLGRNMNVNVVNVDEFNRDTPHVFAPGRQLTPGNVPAYLLR